MPAKIKVAVMELWACFHGFSSLLLLGIVIQISLSLSKTRVDHSELACIHAVRAGNLGPDTRHDTKLAGQTRLA